MGSLGVSCPFKKFKKEIIVSTTASAHFTSLVGKLNLMFPGNRTKPEPEFQENLVWPGATRLSVSWTTPQVLAGLLGIPVKVKPGIYEIYQSPLLKNRFGLNQNEVFINATLKFWKKQVELGRVRVLTYS